MKTVLFYEKGKANEPVAAFYAHDYKSALDAAKQTNGGKLIAKIME